MTTEHAPKHSTLIEALIAAQSEYPGIPKEATGQARGGRYQYATLPAVLEAVVPALNRNGVALIQSTSFEGESLTLHTILRHTSGQEIVSVVPLPSPQSWQDWGSALTYARRYSITALAGVAPDVDDDGATAQGAPKVEAPYGICPDHGVPYFKTPNMHNPAHKREGGGWCDKPETNDSDLGNPQAATAAATVTVQPPIPRTKMPQSLAMAPHGVCPEHKAVLVPIGQKVGHWRTVAGKRQPCFAVPAPSLDQQDVGEGYTDLGPGMTMKPKEGEQPETEAAPW